MPPLHNCFPPALRDATIVSLPFSDAGAVSGGSPGPAAEPSRPVVVRICAPGGGGALAAVAVIAPEEWESARTVLPEAARRAAEAATSLTLLVPWQAAPERFPRNDGVVRSFVASPGVFAAAADALSLDDCCYDVLARVLSDASGMVDRLSVLQMGAGAPRPVALGAIGRAEDACVVVPHRGSLRHLEVCLASLERQTVRPGRVQVCLDEPVTAGHERLMERYPEAEFFATEPSGVGPYVGRQALGMDGVEEVVVWHDSDDASCADRLQVSHGHLRAGGLDLAGCHELRLDEIDRRVEAVRFPLAVTAALDIGPSHALFHPTSLVRREAFRRAGGFSTAHRYGSDAHFLYRAHFFLRRVENVDAFLYVRRMRPGSLTTGPETRWASPERERQRARWREDFDRVRTAAAPIEETSLWTAHADPMPRVRPLGAPLTVAR
jgi:hypothetical protein